MPDSSKPLPGGAHLPSPSLEQLTELAFDAFHQASRELGAVVVQPAVPILFFGDLAKYRDSPLRIITVGLNPSNAEFPDSGPWSRFPEASELRRARSPADHARYVAALSGYFREDPYRSWFSSYSPLLEAMNASFYDGALNTAVHTDICSPVATNPTWSRLAPLPRSVLISPGRALWHDLVRYLRPHVILVSVAREHLDSITFVAAGEWQVLLEVHRVHPYAALYRRCSINESDSALVVFGRAAQTPFGLVGASNKRLIGAAVRKVLGG